MTDSLLQQPARRPLKIFAFDPMLGRAARNRVSVDVPNEPLAPGPVGSRVEVVDYDGTNRLLYPAVDLDDARILVQGGLDPTESHPFFHQQMVYAVVMRVIENFERALGRRWSFREGRRLRVYPHAMQGRNAYYHDDLHALLFGYFRAAAEDMGPNLPGQTVFTCLSQDIVAHEAAHAMVARLRPRLLEPSNPDVLAFHEGFADIVAIFQHFTFRDVLAEALQQARGDLRASGPLVTLAEQFGYATGRGRALRSAIEERETAPSYASTLEPHDRGAILVASVFDAFFSTYRARIGDLLRIATGGSGVLPGGALHPDLVNRLADEAAGTAQNVLTMCIRAFEYLPPVDVTYGDYLRALVTSDSDAVPDDPLEQRNALIEGFRIRGVYPEGVTSLAVDALRWPRRTIDEPIAAEHIARMLHDQASAFDAPGDAARDGAISGSERAAEDARGLHRYADRHRDALDLHPELPIAVAGFHVSQGWTRDLRFVAQAIIQFVQTVPAELVPHRHGLPLRGGTTVVTDARGNVRYVISKLLPRLQLSDAAAWDSGPAAAWLPMDHPEVDTGAESTAAVMRRLHRGLI
jgi:hypothetical protein